MTESRNQATSVALLVYKHNLQKKGKSGKHEKKVSELDNEAAILLFAEVLSPADTSIHVTSCCCSNQQCFSNCKHSSNLRLLVSTHRQPAFFCRRYLSPLSSLSRSLSLPSSFCLFDSAGSRLLQLEPWSEPFDAMEALPKRMKARSVTNATSAFCSSSTVAGTWRLHWHRRVRSADAIDCFEIS